MNTKVVSGMHRLTEDQMSALFSRLFSPNPSVDCDDKFITEQVRSSEPVVSVSYAPGGVIIDYCHNRLGEPVVFVDKPVSTLETVINRFGWPFENGKSFYLQYDAIGEFLASLIKFYFVSEFTNKMPLQIAPIIKRLSKEERIELRSYRRAKRATKRPSSLDDEGR